MKIENMRHFVVLAKNKSLAKAADDLFISQQGLNKAITSMERELGVRLVKRTYTGTELTETGRIFLATTQEMLDRYDLFLHQLDAYHTECDAEYRRGISALATTYALTAFETTFEDHPLDAIREVDFDTVLECFKEPGCSYDLACVDMFSDEKGSEIGSRELIEMHGCCFVPVFTTRLGVLVNKERPLSCSDEISVEELVKLPIAVIRNKTIDSIVKTIFKQPIIPNIALKTTKTSMYAKWVLGNHAVGLLDSFMYWFASRDPDFGKRMTFIPLKTGFLDTTGFIFRANDERVDVLRAYVDAFKQNFYKANIDYFNKWGRHTRFH